MLLCCVCFSVIKYQVLYSVVGSVGYVAFVVCLLAKKVLNVVFKSNGL